MANGSDERVSQVFIISPYECSIETVESIKGKLQSRTGRVMFLCGRELMEKFEEHYPEFLLFQSGLYGSYVAELQKGLDSDPAITNVLFRQGFSSGPKTLTALYVRPKFYLELRLPVLHLSLPDIQRLLTPLSYSELLVLQSLVVEVGRFVAAITMPSDEGARLGEECQKLSLSMRSGWDSAFDAHRGRTDIGVDQKNKQVARVEIEGAKVLAELAGDLLSRAIPVIDGFKHTLASAKRVVEGSLASPTEAIESELMLAYSQVESVSKQVPSELRMDGPPDRVFEFDESLIEESKADIFITGPAGFGKTSFCKWQTLYDLKRFRDAESNVVPVYIPLHQYAHDELTTFESTFLKAPELLSLWERRNKSAKYRFRLYLDGLDEVPSIQRQKSLLDLALKGKEIEPTISIVVTGREHVVGTHLIKFARIRVREFDENQVNQLAGKWFENDEHSIGEFFQQLHKVPALLPLMRVPLLATLILGVYRNTKTLPESRVSLYEMFVNLLAGGWDVAKGIRRETEFGPNRKLIVLTKLAGSLHIGARRDCTQMDVRSAVDSTLPALNDKWQRLLEETIQDGLLIPVGLNYAFAHLSFQEYLAAKDLFEPTGRKAPMAFKLFLAGDDWWREVITFYISLSTDPKYLEKFIRNMGQKVISKTANEGVTGRVHYLLEELLAAFPGAELRFTRWKP